MKTCKKCLTEKAVSEFTKYSRSKDGLNSKCRVCLYAEKKDFYERNRETILPTLRENAKAWAQRNPEKRVIGEQRRRARMKELPNDFTTEQWNECVEYFGDSCAYCGATDEALQQEHVVALTKGGGYTAYNIVPACGPCNVSKQNKEVEEWYRGRESFDETRLDKIYHYLNEKEERTYVSEI